jgi:hypothetical protein
MCVEIMVVRTSLVTEQGLEGADVGARLEPVGCEAVPEGVARGALVDLRRSRRVVDSLLHRRLVEEGQHPTASCRIGARARGGEEGLPGEGCRRVGHLDAEGVGQVDLASPRGELGLVTSGNGFELGPLRVTGSDGEEGGTVVLAFAAAAPDLAPLAVDVLDADGERLEQAKAAALKQLAKEPKGRSEAIEQGHGFLPRQHRRQMRRPLSEREALQARDMQIEHAFVEEEEGAERLVGPNRCAVERDRENANLIIVSAR